MLLRAQSRGGAACGDPPFSRAAGAVTCFGGRATGAADGKKVLASVDAWAGTAMGDKSVIWRLYKVYTIDH
jgi:hypothetical protein